MNFSPLEIAFWLILLLLVHCYVLFPVTLPFLSELFRRRRDSADSREPYLPAVSLLVSAFNEESVIEKKIQNFLAIDYPKDRVQILIGDDGSKDHTAEIVARYADRGITLVKAEKNAGKAAMLNRLQKAATGEFLIFSDANTMFFPNVIRKLVAPFRDPKIGCVCGHLILSDTSASALGQGESSYWDLESEIKKFEGRLDLLIGGNGALYAIRNKLYTQLPVRKSVMDDFFITVNVLAKGGLCTFVPSAIGTEQTSKEGTGEYRRKVRIGRANYNYLLSYLPLLNPVHPLLAYMFFSHKLLRWFTPQLGIALFIVNAFLLPMRNPVYIFSFAVMASFVLVALTKLSKSAYYFLLMNFAMLKGFFLSFKREQGGGWAREARGDEPGPVSKPLSILLLAGVAFSLSVTPAHAGFTADVSAGVLNPADGFTDFNLDVAGHVWYHIDQMVLVGLGSGYTKLGDVGLVPALASLWVRLPIGSQVLPVVTLDGGYAFGDDAQWMWKFGGGLDIKNGDNSSILILGGYESLAKKRYGNFVYVRAGLLVEF